MFHFVTVRNFDCIDKLHSHLSVLTSNENPIGHLSIKYCNVGVLIVLNTENYVIHTVLHYLIVLFCTLSCYPFKILL